jgi:hypothetical protein
VVADLGVALLGRGPRPLPHNSTDRSSTDARGHEMRRLRGVVETADPTRLGDAAVEIEPALLRGRPAPLQFRIGQAALVGELHAGFFGKAIDILRTTLGGLALEHAELMPALRDTSVPLPFPNDQADLLATASPALPVKKLRTCCECEHWDVPGGRAFIPLRRSGDAGQDVVWSRRCI